MAQEEKDLIAQAEGGVATVTLNRPRAYNAYLQGTLRRLAEDFNAFAADDTVGVIVLTGAGTRAFCTGGDVKEYASTFTQKPHAYWAYMQDFRRAVESILECGKPVIARVNGMAIGGGNELLLACDLAVAAEHARIGQVGTQVGSVACGGATQWLPLVVGDKRAREMLFLNPHLPARRAHAWGLLNDVVPSVRRGDDWIEEPSEAQIEKAHRGEDGYRIDFARLDARVAEIAQAILAKFPECVRYTKAQVNALKEKIWHETIGHAADWLSIHFTTREPWEGMSAFVEKRRADVAGIRAALARGESPEFLWGPPSQACPKCGAKGLPGRFSFCGLCGTALRAR